MVLSLGGYAFAEDNPPCTENVCVAMINFNYEFGRSSSGGTPATYFVLLPSSTDKVLLPSSTDKMKLPGH